jgi:hypothetical protein
MVIDQSSRFFAKVEVGQRQRQQSKGDGNPEYVLHGLGFLSEAGGDEARWRGNVGAHPNQGRLDRRAPSRTDVPNILNTIFDPRGQHAVCVEARTT